MLDSLRKSCCLIRLWMELLGKDESFSSVLFSLYECMCRRSTPASRMFNSTSECWASFFCIFNITVESMFPLLYTLCRCYLLEIKMLSSLCGLNIIIISRHFLFDNGPVTDYLHLTLLFSRKANNPFC